MRKLLMLTASMVICAVVVLAQAHIPTRYSGAFPSDGVRMKITGTFTGTALTLKFVVKAAGNSNPTRTGTYSCKPASPTKTRCDGTFRSGDGKYTGTQFVKIIWNGGKPVALAFGH